MLTVSSIIGCIYLACLLMLAAGVWRAPEGFEDDQGFHAVRRSSPDEESL